VVPLVAVSGAECIEALLIAGFSLTARTGSEVMLTKDLRVVVVPDVPILAPDDLMAILRSAGVPYSEFLELLSESPTDPAISRTRLSPTVVHR
jgi:predicted RNA binding protein YcfA (HicA-like mRNA interferase family)